MHPLHNRAGPRVAGRQVEVVITGMPLVRGIRLLRQSCSLVRDNPSHIAAAACPYPPCEAESAVLTDVYGTRSELM